MMSDKTIVTTKNIVPRVSVLIPTYNYAHFLDEAIQSVLAQTFQDYELIIVDNCSTDNTDEVVKKYLTDPRIHYYKNEKNLGLVGNWNKCLEYAKGEYIKFLCADDKFHPEIIEKFTKILDEYENVSIVTCYRQDFGNSTKVRKLPGYLQSGKQMLYDTIHKYQYLGEPTAVMFRKRDLYVGNFREGYTCIVDIEMYTRLMAIGDCYVIPEALSYMRDHSVQVSKLTKRVFASTFEDYMMCKNIMRQKGYNIDVSDLNLEVALHKKAKQCAKLLYKVLPKIHKAESRGVFKKAYKIAVAHGVIFDPLKRVLYGATSKKAILKSFVK